MRNAIQSISLLLFIILASSEANAQIQNVWVGGTPGRPIDWDVASNWSLQRVPNEFHDILIPNTASTTFSYPTIDELVEINSLRIENGAKLYILEKGELQLMATGMKMNDVLANHGEIENRSHSPIGFHKSVFFQNNMPVTVARN